MSDDPSDAEELAWELPAVEQDVGDDRPSDGTLIAYREGRLSELEQRRVEWLLARNARARGRLAELAGIESVGPPARIRRSVLGRRGAGARAGWKVAAVLVVVSLAGFAGWRVLDGGPAGRSGPTASLPADLEYDVTVAGLAARRGPGGVDDLTGVAEATASTVVRILVEPRRDAVAGLEFGVYRPLGDALRRVVPGGAVRIEASRGAASIEAPAADLVGGTVGTRDFFVVIAPEGALPAGGALDGHAPAEWLAKVSGGRVYRRSLRIVEER